MPEPQTPAPQNDKLLIAEGLEVSYGTTQVLWGVSFNVARGKVTCIIGANGAGKTTSLNTIAGVLRAKKGRLLLNGDNITSLSTRDRVRRHISLVPEGRQLWPGMSVEENLLMGCFLRQFRPKAHPGAGAYLQTFPPAERTPPSDGRHALRRRAADVRHRAGLDVRASAPHAG